MSDRTGEEPMRQVWIAGLVLIGTVAMSGCVAEKKYQEALTEAETAKTELERTRAQKNALEQQVKTLKDLNAKFGVETQSARDELQRIEHGRDKERDTIEVRTKELEDKIKQLNAQNRSIRQEYDETRRHNDQLKSLVARYQKEMKERSRSLPGTLAPSSVPPGPSTSAPSAVQPNSSAVAPPSAGTPSLMNVNKASASDMVLVLGLNKDMADRVVSNRPYRVKGELVAKNVVPKETFDMIKDRITVSP
jgi:DNA uptake protein ComE-like DNA-binding protein